MRLINSAVRGLRATIQGGYGTRYGTWGRSFASRDGIDVNREAGARVDNSIVYSAIAKTTLALLEPSIIVRRPVGNDKYETVPDHPITQLLNRPIPWHSGATLRACWVMAEILHGNAYCLKHRSPNGKLIGLEYLPISTCRPVSNPGSGNFIDHYTCIFSSGAEDVDPSNILHTRWHTVNPWTTAVSIGPLESVLPEIATDNRAARYEANVLRNGGKAHLLTPRGQDRDGRPLTFGDEQRRQLEQVMRENAGGDSVGSMAAVSYPMDVLEIGWKPSDLALGATRDLSEERIAAAIGAPISWLGLGSGLASDSNRATRQVADRQALKDYILPMLANRAAQLTDDLVPELGEPGDLVCYNLWDIASWREMMLDLINSGVTATGGPVVSINEYRTKFLMMDPIDDGDQIRGVIEPTDDTQPFEKDEEND